MYCFQRTTRAHDAGSTPLLFIGKLSDDNGGSNRDGEKLKSLDWQNSNFALASRVFCPLFLLSDHDYDVKRPNFTFRQKMKEKTTFFFFS